MSKIVLASASPRRRKIMEMFACDFSVISADIDEKIHSGEEPKHIVMALALEKALKVSELCKDNDIIIAADTIVVVNSEILGKPEDEEDAFRMLKKLENKIHDVITGVAVIHTGTTKKFVSYAETKVKIKQLTDDLIRRYIGTEEVWDKAGSYAIQGKGAALVDWINGDYYNVVGLPISSVIDMLRNHFDIELL